MTEATKARTHYLETNHYNKTPLKQDVAGVIFYSLLLSSLYIATYQVATTGTFDVDSGESISLLKKTGIDVMPFAAGLSLLYVAYLRLVNNLKKSNLSLRQLTLNTSVTSVSVTDADSTTNTIFVDAISSEPLQSSLLTPESAVARPDSPSTRRATVAKIIGLSLLTGGVIGLGITAYLVARLVNDKCFLANSTMHDICEPESFTPLACGKMGTNVFPPIDVICPDASMEQTNDMITAYEKIMRMPEIQIFFRSAFTYTNTAVVALMVTARTIKDHVMPYLKKQKLLATSTRLHDDPEIELPSPVMLG